MLVLSTAKLPPILTRVATTSHFASTQGLGVPLGRVKGQPEMVKVSCCVAANWPSIFTLVLEVTMENWPE